MSLGVGVAAYYLVRTGKLKPNKKFGAGPKVFSSSFLGYWVGKISYILSDACKDKFLKDAPESETAYHIRKERGLTQPWTAIRDFGNKNNDEDEDDDEDYIQIKITIPSLRSIINPGTTKDDKNLVLNEKENKILDECERRSNFFYSLPLSLICGASMFVAQKKNWISKLRETNIKWIKKLPHFPFRSRSLHGIVFGYTLGQFLYIMSLDCEERFLKYAPDGDVAKRIREQREENGEDKANNQVEDEIPSNTKNQSNSTSKNDIFDIDPDTHSTYITNYNDISSIDWLEKREIEIPEKLKDEE